MNIAEKVIRFYRNSPLPSVTAPPLVENPYATDRRAQVIEVFYKKYFSDENARTHIVGINPSRLTDTSTGIHYTDGKSLAENCDIENDFSKGSELTARFFYKVVEYMGGAARFYSNVFPWAAMPFSITLNGEYRNYYENDVSEKLEDAVVDNLIWLSSEIASNGKLIVLGTGDHQAAFKALSGFPFGYDSIKYLPHPRWIMQYNSADLEKWLDAYAVALST